ncbi:hypothetical protein IUY40_06605 [Flavobacterium sp. ALJ2]|uniref:hypothetical protein n=1 Tax=Flavobacterium sp. ALJ2 TaxID=2786960 RepID=UPI00189DABA4|nr:hypothetical protein [Flavobacterium sp. ALJ2]MBF7091205.1 hypothetical protein [Flavobacterium sp. ALJ2]
MTHSEYFLKKLASEKVTGDFYPFDTGEIDKVEDYIRQIVGRLKNNQKIIIEPDFDYYGSGFASYINVRISKRDKSDSKITTDKNRVTKCTKGLLLYISNLTPFWYYGTAEWDRTTENGVFKSGSTGFLRPHSIDNIDTQLWTNDIEKIKLVMSDFGYYLLTRQEVEDPIDFKVNMASNLIEKPTKVFDCFFHWED